MDKKIKVQNLKCSGCIQQIKNKLNELNGVNIKGIDLADGSVTLSVKDSQSLKEVVDQLNRLGYPLSNADNSKLLKAKSYVSCAIGRVSKLT